MVARRAGVRAQSRPSQPSRGGNRCLGAWPAFGVRGDDILGAVKRAPRRARAAVQRGRRPSAVHIQGKYSRALWAGWRPRVRQQGARESVGARSLTRTRRATGSATAMITRDSPMNPAPGPTFECTAETQVLNLLLNRNITIQCCKIRSRGAISKGLSAARLRE